MAGSNFISSQYVLINLSKSGNFNRTYFSRKLNVFNVFLYFKDTQIGKWDLVNRFNVFNLLAATPLEASRGT